MNAMPALPDGFLEMVAPLLAGDLQLFAESLDEQHKRGIRFHKHKVIIPPIGTLHSIPWAENSYYLSSDSTAGVHPLHDAGAYYIQEPSAMAAAAALPLQQGNRILDLCAAPGGKSTQLAALMSGGLLVCNETVAGRAIVLSRNIERMGIANAIVVSATPEDLARRWKGFFDSILVDAPCSGEGMFRKNPETRKMWNKQTPPGCAARQSLILKQAASMLKPGGHIVYSTCTFNCLENENVIFDFLSNHPEFSLAPFTLACIPAYREGMLRIWPHQTAGEGHFVAMLRKSENAETCVVQNESAILEKPGKADLCICGALLKDLIENPPVPNAVFGNKLVLAPSGCPPLDSIRIYRLGLHIGEVRGRIFKPDHALSLAGFEARSLELDEKDAERYQRGETLKCPETLRGYAAASLCGLPLGFGKASGGEFKNHYPKGLWRNRANTMPSKATDDI